MLLSTYLYLSPSPLFTCSASLSWKIFPQNALNLVLSFTRDFPAGSCDSKASTSAFSRAGSFFPLMSDYSNSDDDQADLPQDDDLLALLKGSASGGPSFLTSVGALADPDDPSRKKRKRQVREQEALYERKARKGEVDPDEVGANVVKRLPIKLASGQLQAREGETVLPRQTSGRKGDSDDGDSASEPEEEWSAPRYQPEGAGLGTRWGRMAVADVVRIKKPAERRQVAKEQIAGLGAEIVAGGELVDNVRPATGGP